MPSMRAGRPLGVLLLLLISALWMAAPNAQSKSAQAKPGQAVTRSTPKDPPLVRRRVDRDREEKAREARGRRTPGAAGAETTSPTMLDERQANSQGNGPKSEPREHRMQRAGSFDGDLRSLPSGPVK